MDVQGYAAPGFEPVADAFAANFESGDELGAGFAAVLEGERVVELWGGQADRKGRPWAQDTIVPVYSTTKPIAALVIAMLVEQGALDYEAPVARYWPEFGAHGKDKVTVAQALSHQAGVPGFIEPIDPDLWLDPPALSAALAPLAPLWEPGTASGYHALTYGYIAGELVRRVSPRSLGTILREDICAPRGIDFQIGLPDEDHPRCAEIVRPNAAADLGEITPPKRAAFVTPWAAPNRGGAAWRRVEMPAANGHGTALAVARLYAAFAEGGAIDGAPLFSGATYDALTRRRIIGQDLVLPAVMEWAAGVMRNNNKIYGPNSETLAHAGWGGSMALGDPDRRLSAAYVMNKQRPSLQGDARGSSLIGALYACV